MQVSKTLSLASKVRYNGSASLTPLERKIYLTKRQKDYHKMYWIKVNAYERKNRKTTWRYIGVTKCTKCGSKGYLSKVEKFNLQTGHRENHFIVTHNRYKDGERISTRCHLEQGN